MASLLQLGSRDYITAGEPQDRFPCYRSMPDVPAILRALEADRVREVVGLSLGKAHGVAETDGAEHAAAGRDGAAGAVESRAR